MSKTITRSIAGSAVLLLIATGIGAQAPRARFVRYAEVQRAVSAHAALLPRDLRGLSEQQRDRQWPTWIAGHDREIRARLAQGDEDTIVNWMLFGGSFTSQPPAVFDATRPDQAAESQRVASIMRARARDLVRALAAPGRDERLLFARGLLEAQHLSFDTDADRATALRYLAEAVVRVANDQTGIDRQLDAARTATDPARQLEMRAQVFRERGLSLDTSLVPNYALDRSLGAMQDAGLLRDGRIMRIAIIGPGLDFSDKDSGFDFYPQQTLQPFAVVDSIRRLQPGAPDPDVVVLDISPRVIDHMARAAALAARGDGYTLYLPLARRHDWLPDFRTYWQHFGDQIGAPVPAPALKTVSEIAELRGVRVRPQVVQDLTTTNVNIVTERLDGEGFDLMVATNVFVYYDVLDQAIALSNIGAMLRPGGYFLSNTPMPDAGAPLRLAGSNDVTYWRGQPSSDGTSTAFGDRVFWYQRPR